MSGLFADSKDALGAFSRYAAALSQSPGVAGVLDGALKALMNWPGIDAVCVYAGSAAGRLHPGAQEARRSIILYAIDLEPLAADALQIHQPITTPLPSDHPSGLGGVIALPLIAAPH